jgi:hypothetical protein
LLVPSIAVPVAKSQVPFSVAASFTKDWLTLGSVMVPVAVWGGAGAVDIAGTTAAAGQAQQRGVCRQVPEFHAFPLTKSPSTMADVSPEGQVANY